MAIEFNEGYVKDIAEIGERCKSNSHRLDTVEEDVKTIKDDYKALYEMSANMKTLTEGVIDMKDDVKTIKSEQGEMKSQISDLRTAPDRKKSQWWDKAIGAIVGAVGTGILAYVLSNLTNIFS